MEGKLNGLDLFSGIGGIGIALRPWVRTVAYCETDRYAQGVLLSRTADGTLDRAPIWDDVRTLRGRMLPEIDIIFGGFPCQDISVAGLGAGLGGERSGLFFEIVRLTKECRPTFVFLENVPAIRTRGLDRVLREFTEIGYDCRWTMLSASGMGAPHRRERWFLLAHANGAKLWEQPERIGGGYSQAESPNNGDNGFMADPMRSGLERLDDSGCGDRSGGKTGQSGVRVIGKGITSDWAIEPDVGRVVNGLPNRAHRLRCLGNSVVPIQAREAFERLINL